MLDISPIDGIRSPFGQRRGGGPAPAFSPSTLYSSGSQGIWLDPSDLSTMFSDRAGTTPVTTPGTVVGLRLDKSKGLALGAELVSNGGPFVNTTGWLSGNSALVAVSTSKLRVSGTTLAFPFAYTSMTTVVGRMYVVSATATFVSGSNDNAFLEKSDSAAGNSNNVASDVGPARVITFRFTATATTSYIRLGSFNAIDVNDWDNISVRELAGNHATAPTDAARPVYGIEPKGGRRNLLLQTEGFGDVVWANNLFGAWTNATVTANTDVAPDGTLTADTISLTTSVRNRMQVISVTPNASYTFSLYVKGQAANTYGSGIYLRAATGLNGVLVSLGHATTRVDTTLSDSVYTRFSVSFTVPSSGVNQISVGLTGSGDAPSPTANIYTWGAQLETGSTATNYQRVTTAYDITESGVDTCHYVQYDGSDDSMSTSAIDFTATDKMSVFAGVRKLSDAATGVPFELSSNSSTSAGAFGLLVSVDTSGADRFQSAGTLRENVFSTSASPVTLLYTATADIAAPSITIRKNGIQVDARTTSQGSGNYGNYPFYIGRRGGSSAPFNGRDYGIIVVGKTASAGEISDTETWLAARTAQVTL